MAAVSEALETFSRVETEERRANHRRTFGVVGWGDALVTLPLPSESLLIPRHLS